MQQVTLPESLGNIPCPTCHANGNEPCIRGRAHSTIWQRKMLMPHPHDSRITANAAPAPAIKGFRCITLQCPFQSTSMIETQAHLIKFPRHTIASQAIPAPADDKDDYLNIDLDLPSPLSLKRGRKLGG